MSRTRTCTNAARAMLLLGVLALQSPAATAMPGQQWQFTVYLDDREIGQHHFSLVRDGNAEQLTTRADFDVTFLKIPVYRYRHANVEHWQNGCLQRIDSSTEQNGKAFRVRGERTDSGFRVITSSGEATYPACISTFAYWDRSFLRHQRLLNAQTGELMDVEVAYLGKQPLATMQPGTPAHHYRLTADKLAIEVWYSDDDRWLALQSTTQGGRLLRYVAR